MKEELLQYFKEIGISYVGKRWKRNGEIFKKDSLLSVVNSFLSTYEKSKSLRKGEKMEISKHVYNYDLDIADICYLQYLAVLEEKEREREEKEREREREREREYEKRKQARQEAEQLKEAEAEFRRQEAEEIEQEIADISKVTFSHLHYMWRCYPDGTTHVYHIVNPATRTVELLVDDSPTAIYNSLRSTHAPYQDFKKSLESINKKRKVRQEKEIKEEDFLNDLIEKWKINVDFRLDSDPVTVTFDPSEYNFCFVDSSKFDPDMDTPTMDHFLERLDYPDVFLAFLWSIIDSKHHGRQVLWLHGEGSDFKSLILNTLVNYIGYGAGSISKSMLKNDFGSSVIVGKRLVTYPDCKDSYFLNNELVHSLSGGDSIIINRKFGQPFTSNVYSRIIVASNNQPTIDTFADNAMSRLIYLRIKRTEYEYIPEFKRKLLEEFPGIFARAKESYEKLCEDNYRICLPRKMVEEIETISASEFEMAVNNFIEEYIEFDAEYALKRDVLYKVFSTSCIGADRIYGSTFKRILTQRYDVREARIRSDGKRIQCWLGMRWKNADIEGEICLEKNDKFESE